MAVIHRPKCQKGMIVPMACLVDDSNISHLHIMQPISRIRVYVREILPYRQKSTIFPKYRNSDLGRSRTDRCSW